MKKLVRVMVLDDSPEMLNSICTYLEAYDGLEVIGRAMDGYEMLDMAKQRKPDLIISHVHAPRMGGLEYTLLLREALPATRFITLTDIPSADADRAARDLASRRPELAERLAREIQRLFPGAIPHE